MVWVYLGHPREFFQSEGTADAVILGRQFIVLPVQFGWPSHREPLARLDQGVNNMASLISKECPWGKVSQFVWSPHAYNYVCIALTPPLWESSRLKVSYCMEQDLCVYFLFCFARRDSPSICSI